MRRSRMRAPTWSSIAAVDRPLFGFAMISPVFCCLGRFPQAGPSRLFRQRE
jgi:hypothetical protein